MGHHWRCWVKSELKLKGMDKVKMRRRVRRDRKVRAAVEVGLEREG